MAKLHTYMAGPNHALEPLQRNDEIDLLALVALLWSGRFIIISCIILFGAVGGCYALLAPERFTANAVIYYPSSQDMLVLVPLRTKLDTLGLGGGHQTRRCMRILLYSIALMIISNAS